MLGNASIKDTAVYIYCGKSREIGFVTKCAEILIAHNHGNCQLAESM